VSPYSLSDLSARTERNSAVLTFDQRILDQEILGGVVRGATLNFHAFYNNRRTLYFAIDAGREFRPPTSNPYYPQGAPAGLRVHYSLADELNPRRAVSEIALRWSPELEVELPADWLGRLSYSVSENKTVYNLEHSVNLNMINAALGLTVPAQAGSDALPGQAAFTKPANIPFLNVFCDSTAFQCNSPATLQYISAYERASSTHQIHEWNAQFDGPIYMLPGGEVRAGIGAQLRSWNYRDASATTTGTHSTALEDRPPSGVFGRQIPAAYVQLNVPVFSDMNAIPLVERLVVEGSYRYDHYYDAGPIFSPKVGGEYSPGFGFTLRASWGKSFRAPEANDLVAAQSNVGQHNVLGGAGSNTLRACPIGSATPVPGSAGARLVSLGLASCTGVGAPVFPGGLDATGSAWAGIVGLFRPEFGTGPEALRPETATNTTYGFVYDSEISFLSGLHLEATYWRIEINDTLNHVTAPGQVNLLSTEFAGLVITPDNPGGDFDDLIEGILGLPGAPTDVDADDVVFFIDAARRNHGRLKVDGYDFNARYDYDAGNLGALNFSFAGTYFLSEVISAPGFATIDNLDRDLNAIDMGVSTVPRLKWRGSVGWTDGTISANFYVNHTGHFHTDQVLTAATAQFPDWTNMLPAHTWLDLSLAYNTGTMPVNPYLQNLNLQLTVNDVLDQRAPFAYATAGRGVQAAAFWSERGGGYSPVGRYVTFYVTKEW
jgi:iron complex outermembrane receptor protein